MSIDKTIVDDERIDGFADTQDAERRVRTYRPLLIGFLRANGLYPPGLQAVGEDAPD